MKLSVTHSTKLTGLRRIMTRDVLSFGDNIYYGFIFEKGICTNFRLTCCRQDDLTTVWEHTEENCIAGTINLTEDGDLIVETYHQKVVCFSGTTGEKRWQFTSNSKDALCSTSNINNHRFVVAEFHGSVHNAYCIDSRNGSLLWTAEFADHPKYVRICDNSVFLVSDSHAYCFDVVSGVLRWQKAFTAYTNNALLLDSYLVCGARDKSINLYDKKNGVLVYTFPYAPPVSNMLTIQTEHGSIQFDESIFTSIESLDEGTGNTFYLTTKEGVVHSIEIEEKKGLLHSIKLSSSIVRLFQAEHIRLLSDTSAPECPVTLCTLLNPDSLCIGEDTGNFVVINSSDGKEITRLKPKLKGAAEKMIVIGSALYLLCTKGYVYRVEISHA